MPQFLAWIWKKWSQPFGVWHVLQVALPLMVSTVCYSVMQFIDRLFLLYDSSLAVGAIVTIGTLVWTLISLPLGIVSYVTTFVAQYQGAKQPGQIGRSVMHAVYLALACFPLLLLPILFAEEAFLWFGHAPELARMEGRCFAIYILSGLGMLINGVLEGLLVGLERNRPVMFANLYATLLNVILDPLLIFGWGGFPALGIEGAAWATVIAMWAKFVYLMWIVGRLPDLSEFQFLRGMTWDVQFIRRFLFFGFPSGLQWFVEGVAITYFVMVMGRLDGLYLAATSLALSVNMLAFVPIYGLGMGLTAIIGNQLGQDSPQTAKRAVYSAMVIGLVYTGIFVVLYTVFPHWLLALHRGQAEDFPALEPIVLQFLIFVAVYCLFDTIQIVMVGVLKGAGDTWYVTWTILVTSLLFLGWGTWMDQPHVDRGDVALRWWLALTGWLATLAILYVGRVIQGKWLHVRVIESTVVGANGSAGLQDQDPEP